MRILIILKRIHAPIGHTLFRGLLIVVIFRPVLLNWLLLLLLILLHHRARVVFWEVRGHQLSLAVGWFDWWRERPLRHHIGIKSIKLNGTRYFWRLLLMAANHLATPDSGSCSHVTAGIQWVLYHAVGRWLWELGVWPSGLYLLQLRQNLLQNDKKRVRANEVFYRISRDI